MTNLDASAITEIERLTREADPVVIPSPEQRGVYFLRGADGSLTRHRAALDPQDVTVYDLDSLNRAIEEAIEIGDANTLYVHDDGVVLVCEIEHERRVVRLPLPTHPAFKLIGDWKTPTLLAQKELVRLIRTQLSHHVDATVIPTFSSLRMTSSTDGTSTVTPSSAALDRRIVRQVQADQGREVPEYILFTPPVYDIPEDRDEQYALKVYVEFDHDKEKFVLVAVHDDLRRAREQAVARIVAQLRGRFESAVPVLYGQPR